MTQINSSENVSRRTILKTGLTTAAVASLPLNAWGTEDAASRSPKRKRGVLPKRTLGRTGMKVSILRRTA